MLCLQEFNHDKETVRSLQIWMTPDRRGHEPQYGSSRYVKEDRHNKLLAILGGSKPAPKWDGIAPGKGINLHQVFLRGDSACAQLCFFVLHAAQQFFISLQEQRTSVLVFQGLPVCFWYACLYCIVHAPMSLQYTSADS